MFDTGKEEVAYLADIDGKIPSDAVSGNIAVFGPGGTLADGGKSPSSFATPADVESAVGGALTEAWDAISGEYAVAAYKASAWESISQYYAGDFCMYGGEGYICREEHTSGETFSEDSDKWKKVLTAGGKAALDAMLSAIVSGAASIEDLAPNFSDSETYSVNQLVKKDGVLKICTSAGTGDGALFSSATVEEAIQARYDALLALIPEDQQDPGWLRQAALDAEYVRRPTPYSAGDTCTHEGKFYRCRNGVLSDSDWDPSQWEEITFKAFLASGVMQKKANWAETNTSDPSFIQNKPTIPVVDDTLLIEGAAADAKVVGQKLLEKADINAVPELDPTLSLEGYAAEAYQVGRALAGMAPAGSLPYKIKILGGTTYSDSSDSSSPDDSSSAPIYDPNDPTKVGFELEDRAVNVVDMTMEGNLDTIVLTPPPSLGAGLARDFYVVFHVDSVVKVKVNVSGTSLKGYTGRSVEIDATSESAPAYRFTEISRYGNVFLVTCMADPAYAMVKEIDRALDDILFGIGETPDFEKGVYIPDEQDANKLYKIVAVNDGGEVNIGIEQNPVEL